MIPINRVVEDINLVDAQAFLTFATSLPWSRHSQEFCPFSHL